MTDGPTCREEAEVGGADKQRAATDDTKVRGLMSPQASIQIQSGVNMMASGWRFSHVIMNSLTGDRK